MNREAYGLWQLETKLLDDLLVRVEQAEHAILREIRCPTGLVAIYAILNGERRPPWRKRTAAHDKSRALHAMHALAQIAKTRGYLAIGKENPRLAAHAALLAGLHANDAAVNAVLAARRRIGGRTRGLQKTERATKHDAAIEKEYGRWQMSYELQDQYRSVVAYIKEKTDLDTRTIQRRVRRLRAGKPRQ